MKTPSLLLFDLGGALVENAGFERLNRLLPQPLDESSIRDRWLASSVVRQFELGEIGAETFANRFTAEWRLAVSASDFLADFAAWPKGLYPGAQEMVRSLRRKYRVGCLSNSNALHWSAFESFIGQFDVALSSHLLGSIKPDRAAFVRALDECGAGPEEVCFFDDSIANVRAAHGLGIRAFHADGFRSLQDLPLTQGLL